MKPTSRLRLLLLQACVLTAVLFAFAPLALAQSGPPSVPPITTAYVVTAVLGILLGFLAQGVKQGNLLGILMVPQAWAPYLAVLLTLGTGIEQGIQGQPTLTGAVWLNAVFTAMLGLISQTGGAALHGHLHSAPKAKPASGSGASVPRVDPVTAEANKLAPQAPANKRGRDFVSGIFAPALMVVLTGCAALWGATSATLDCGSKVAADAAQGMSVPEILADMPSQCGYDLAQIVAIIAASKDPKVTSSKAYVEVLKMKSALDAAPAGN